MSARTDEGPAVSLDDVSFAYSFGGAKALNAVSLEVPRGGRLVLVGSNGAGKTTLLKILGGKRRPSSGRALVLGRPAFETTALALDVALVTDEWDPEFVSSVPTKQLLASAATFGSSIRSDSQRASRLLVALGVDTRVLSRELSSLSTGERRRVQLLCALLPPRALIILDEATNTLDVRSRAALLGFLKEEECGARGATVVLCTHIFDGIDGWATHVAQLERGHLVRSLSAPELPAQMSIYVLVKGWLEGKAEERSAALAEASELAASLLLAAPSNALASAAQSLTLVPPQNNPGPIRSSQPPTPAAPKPAADPVPIRPASPSAGLASLPPSARIMIDPIKRALEQLSMAVGGCSSALGGADLQTLEKKAGEVKRLMEGTTRALDAFIANAKSTKQQVPSKRPASGMPEGWGNRHQSEEELIRQGVILPPAIPP